MSDAYVQKPESFCAAKMPVAAFEGFPVLSECRKMLIALAVAEIMNCSSHKREGPLNVSGAHLKKLFFGDDINQFGLFLHLLGKDLAH